MKRLIIMLLATTLIASEGISQNSTDTICLPSSQLKKAINRIETCKVIEEELTITKEQLSVSNERLLLKDSIINKYTAQVGTYNALINNYTKNITNLEQIVNNQKKAINLQSKAIRRQKLSKWVSAILGVGLGILISK